MSVCFLLLTLSSHNHLTQALSTGEPCSYEPGTFTAEHKSHSVMVTAGLQLHAQPMVQGSWVPPLLTYGPLS